MVPRICRGHSGNGYNLCIHVFLLLKEVCTTRFIVKLFNSKVVDNRSLNREYVNGARED